MRRILVLAAVAVWGWPALAQAPSVSPAAAEALGKLYVQAVNSDTGVTAFLERDVEPVPPAAIRGFFEDQRWISGGVEFVGARPRPGNPHKVDVAVRGRLYGAVQGIELTVDESAEPRITYLDLIPAPAWAVDPNRQASRAVVARRVDALVRRGCDAERFSGAVLVARGADVLVQRACGQASRRWGVPNTLTTRINIGSMDKMFTAVAVMQLVEQGKVSLDATLDRYLDGTWVDPETARKVTIWQLMTHTSGLAPDVVDLSEEDTRDRIRSLADYAPLALKARTTFTPGEKFEYSNTGMVLLGAVIEKASGEAYDDYVRRHVLAPAAMTATGQVATDEPVPVAMGHMRAPDAPTGWRENSRRVLLRGIPAGGGYSTVGDLHRFALALQGGKLLGAENLARMWADDRGFNYGAGFEIGQGAVGKSVGHTGFHRGVSTQMRLYLDSGYIVVVLANTDRGGPPLVDAIEGVLPLVATR